MAKTNISYKAKFPLSKLSCNHRPQHGLEHISLQCKTTRLKTNKQKKKTHPISLLQPLGPSKLYKDFRRAASASLGDSLTPWQARFQRKQLFILSLLSP